MVCNSMKRFVAISFLAVFVLPSYVYFYVAPKFEAFVDETAQEDAVLIAGHLASMLLQSGKEIEEGKAVGTISRLDGNIREGFHIAKLKLYLPDGRIIFSSEAKDIGGVNNREYFFKQVAQGKNVTRIVRKDTLSLENHVVPVDVVETYVPIMRNGTFMGALEIYFDITRRQEHFHSLMYHIYIVVTISSAALLLAEIMGAVKANSSIRERRQLEKQLHEISITDELTGLLNRRGFILMARKHVQLARRNGEEFALLYADMDDLKSINDTLGHKAGDQALKEISSVLKTTFREADIIGRLGGDEFAVLLTSYSEADKKTLISQRLQGDLQRFNKKSGNSYDLSISVGLVCYHPDKGGSLDQLMAEADTLMYQAKQQRKKGGHEATV